LAVKQQSPILKSMI